MSVIVRHATAADVDALASLHNALLATTTIEWTDTPHTPDGMLEWLDEHDKVIVAEVRGEVVGLAAFGPFRDIVQRPGYRFTVESSVPSSVDGWISSCSSSVSMADQHRRRTED